MTQQSEEKQLTLITVIATALGAIAESPLGWFVGFGLMIGLGKAAENWDGHLFSQKGCFEVQELSGEPYKVNTCNGDIEKIILQEKKTVESTK